MSKFILISAILHIIIFFMNMSNIVKNQYRAVMNQYTNKISILKVKQTPVEKINIETTDFLNENLIEKIENEKPLMLPEREQFIKTARQREIVNRQPDKNTPTINYFYLPLKYSGQKIPVNKPEDTKSPARPLVVNKPPSQSSNYIARYPEIRKEPTKSNSSNFDEFITDYRDAVYSIVYRQFAKYVKNKRFKNESCVVEVSINSEGRVLNINFKKPSENEEFNLLCMNVIKEIGNFPPFPKVVDVEVIKLTIPLKINLSK
ncbi:MAG: TonB C-terminal domain-containing protein [Planctomycetota bacterium]